MRNIIIKLIFKCYDFVWWSLFGDGGDSVGVVCHPNTFYQKHNGPRNSHTFQLLLIILVEFFFGGSFNGSYLGSYEVRVCQKCVKENGES